MLAARTDLNAALKDAGRTGHSGTGLTRVRTILVTVELALSLALLVASSLLVRSFINVISQAPGYRTEKLVFQRVVLPSLRYGDNARSQFGRTLLDRVAALPGVQSAALASDTPLDGNVYASSITIEGDSFVPAENEGRAYIHIVTGGFFETTGMTLLQGGGFDGSTNSNSEPVVIVSERLARRFWPKGDAIGKRFKLGKTNSQNPWLRITGVVADAKHRSLIRSPATDPDLYLSFEQRPAPGFAIVLRTAGNGRSVGAAVRQVVASLDATIPVFELATIEQRISRASASQRFSAQLMGVFSVVALLLAAIGLYGVVSFSVGQRTQEIGVRMALGARPVDILALILAGTGRLVTIGLLAGSALAIVLTRFIQALLFNVNAHDPLTYIGVGLVLATVALFAAWLPARRASRVDPMAALRTE